MTDDPTFDEAKAEMLKCERRFSVDTHDQDLADAITVDTHDQDLADAITGALMSADMSVVLEKLANKLVEREVRSHFIRTARAMLVHDSLLITYTPP